MTIVQAEELLDEVERCVRAYDDAEAVKAERKLWRATLHAVSKGTNIYHSRKLAIISLKTTKIYFRRGS